MNGVPSTMNRTVAICKELRRSAKAPTGSRRLLSLPAAPLMPMLTHVSGPMSISRLHLIVAAASLSGLLLGTASCASVSPGSGSTLLPLFRATSDARSNDRLFVSDLYASQILIYPAHVQNPAPIGRISQGVSYPYNLAVDQTGTLYVQNNDNLITEYPRGSTKPRKTLMEPPGRSGIGVCVTVGGDGTVYAADFFLGQVYEFAGGSRTPTKTLTVTGAFGLALDRENDLFVGWSSGSRGPGHVMEFKPGSSSGHDLGITVRISGGLAVDSSDDLLVGDQGAQVVDIFRPGATKPFRTINTAPNYPYQFAFDRREAHVYLVSGNPAAVYVYDYATGKLAWTVTRGLPGGSGYAEGVAVRPAAAQ